MIQRSNAQAPATGTVPRRARRAGPRVAAADRVPARCAVLGCGASGRDRYRCGGVPSLRYRSLLGTCCWCGRLGSFGQARGRHRCCGVPRHRCRSCHRCVGTPGRSKRYTSGVDSLPKSKTAPVQAQVQGDILQVSTHGLSRSQRKRWQAYNWPLCKHSFQATYFRCRLIA
jgi:hypothetical protein